MTAKNEADRLSEEKRKRKRTAINKHLNKEHAEQAPPGKRWTDAMKGMTTVDRMNWHYDLHEGDTHSSHHPNHSHEDLEDWEELERMNNGIS